MEYKKIAAGLFRMGTDGEEGFIEDYEGPSVQVAVDDFLMADTPVTNEEFARFVKETGYLTLATRQGNSYVFELFIDEAKRKDYPRVAGTPWWLVVQGADWEHPFGPDSHLQGLEQHPVVHVALEDALAYCAWAGASLPTEAQWEYAARAGSDKLYPWGDELVEDGQYRANTWQGDFPEQNTALDGYVGTAPVYSYQPNAYGLYQMIGNVWEWCRNPRYTLLDDFNTEDFRLDLSSLGGEYAIRGGSFLCHCSYCNRYRVAARNGADCRSTTSHMSFRCIKETR